MQSERSARGQESNKSLFPHCNNFPLYIEYNKRSFLFSMSETVYIAVFSLLLCLSW